MTGPSQNLLTPARIAGAPGGRPCGLVGRGSGARAAWNRSREWFRPAVRRRLGLPDLPRARCGRGNRMPEGG